MHRFIKHYPFRFALLIVAAQLGLAAALRLVLGLSSAPINLETLATGSDLLVAVLVAILLTRLHWWQEAGFNGPHAWHNLHVLWFPLLVTALPFLGGMRLPASGTLLPLLVGTLIGVVQEEAIFRGLLWRTLAPKGVVVTTLITAVLFGAIHIGIVVLGGPVEVAIQKMIVATCAGVLYGAVRYRTNSIWPVLLLHAAFNLVDDFATAEMLPALIGVMNIAITFGFAGYGFFLLRGRLTRMAQPQAVTVGVE